MTQLEAQRILNEGTGGVWKTSRLRDSEVLVRWLPVASFKRTGTVVGLSNDGNWVISGRDDVVIKLSESTPPVPLLPFLERSYSQAIELIRTGLADNKLPLTLAEYFPVVKIITCALTTGSDYWADLALKWLETVEINQEIADALSQVANAKRASQSTRHRASRLLTGWGRDKAR